MILIFCNYSYSSCLITKPYPPIVVICNRHIPVRSLDTVDPTYRYGYSWYNAERTIIRGFKHVIGNKNVFTCATVNFFGDDEICPTNKCRCHLKLHMGWYSDSGIPITLPYLYMFRALQARVRFFTLFRYNDRVMYNNTIVCILLNELNALFTILKWMKEFMRQLIITYGLCDFIILHLI